MKAKHGRIKVGDYFAINLGKRYAIGQYVYPHKFYGTLVRITDYFLSASGLFDLELAEKASDLFPPVFTFLKGAVSDGIWKKVGHSTVSNFTYPDFVSYFSARDRFEAKQWFLEKDGKIRKLGTKLPKKYLNLEVLVIWSLEDLKRRIQTGVNPYDRAKH